VFAGGGCRCFWQAGFWQEAAPALGLSPGIVGAVSAGSAFACAIFAGALDRVLDEFGRRVAANERNIYLANAWRGEPVFPHEQIYRSSILATRDDDAFERLQSGPEVRVTLALPPPWLGPRSGFLLAALAHQGDFRANRVHAIWGRRFGFRSEVVSVQSCSTREELADLILMSSCMPPVIRQYQRNGRAVLDGGLVDNAPIEAVEGAENTLVLLTRKTDERSIPRVAGRTYAQPSEPIPVDKWDYTSPEGIQKTFDLGRRDGEAFAREAQAA